MSGGGPAVGAAVSLPAAHAPDGDNAYRITWIAGQDRMVAICHCGAQLIGDDPAELWLWLLEHPNHPGV